MRAYCWGTGGSWIKFIFSWFVCPKSPLLVSDVDSGDYGAKESVTIFAHVRFSHKDESEPATSLLKGQWGKNMWHTGLQEINHQWVFSVPELSLDIQYIPVLQLCLYFWWVTQSTVTKHHKYHETSLFTSAMIAGRFTGKASVNVCLEHQRRSSKALCFVFGSLQSGTCCLISVA